MNTVQTQYLSLFSEDKPFLLDSGTSLPQVRVAYETYGALNARCDNAILVCHALTGSAHAAGVHAAGDSPGWWDPLIGPGRALDTDQYFVICSNILGSCYGSTGPTSQSPWTNAPYGSAFPVITVRDMVRVQKELLDQLGVKGLFSAIGSSLGGMQVLEWGLLYPDFCETLIPISVAARQPAWCIAWNSAARAAIRLDPEQGLATARMIGMISYRSAEEFEERFGTRREHEWLSRFDSHNAFEIERYLEHHGRKLLERFDAQTYVCLSRAMDLHDTGWNRGGTVQALKRIRARVLSIGVSSDVRYPVCYQQEIASGIPGACYGEIESAHGHDSFLIEYEQLTDIVGGFLQEITQDHFQKAAGWR